MKMISDQLIHARASVRNSWPVWYGILNRPARNNFAANPPSLGAIQERIVRDMRENGIAFITLDELFPGEGLLAKLVADMQARDYGDDKSRRKKFLKPFWDEQGTFDLSNPFFELSLRKEVLDIVNSYDNMWRRLNSMTLFETIPVGDAAPVQSQQWHRDPQEKRQVKTFIYLNDVDAETGPFTYVKRSQYGSPVYGNLFKQYLPLGSYPPTAEIEKAVAPADIISATGKAGTMIFCDTAGLHRGGYAKSKSRFMFTGFYPSAKWTEPRQYTPHVDAAKLSPEARFALYLN